MKFSPGDILVPKHCQYPDGALVVHGHDERGRMLAHPIGGGLQFALEAEAVGQFRLVDEGERTRALFRRVRFNLGDPADNFTGWTNGESWNGFAKPHFEFAEAQRLLAWLKYDGARFDAARDAFVTLTTEDEEEVWAATTIAITDGTRIKVYPVGAAAWCWDET